jgi:hypothetical protein
VSHHQFRKEAAMHDVIAAYDYSKQSRYGKLMYQLAHQACVDYQKERK